MSEWISVKDRLPEKRCQYLCVRKGYLTGVSVVCILTFNIKTKKFYDFDRETWEEFEISNITHWMELPMPPQGD